VTHRDVAAVEGYSGLGALGAVVALAALITLMVLLRQGRRPPALALAAASQVPVSGSGPAEEPGAEPAGSERVEAEPVISDSLKPDDEPRGG
jgi:hypothetical protein